MAALRSDHHRRQAEDYNEVPVISCEYGFFTDSRDDEDRQLTEAEAIAVGATPILVIRDKRSKMIHADCVLCKGIEDEFPIETTTKWILGLGYPEVIIRTDGESSIVALSRRVGEKLREAGVKTMHNTSPAYDSRSAGHAESGVRIVKEKVRTLICFARELHGVTIEKSHVSLPWFVRFAAQIINRSHSGTDGMTGYRRTYGRSRMPRRCVPWSEKVFYLEQSKRKVQVEAKWHEGIFLGIKDESEIAAVGTPHGIVFSRRIRRVPKEDSGDGMLFNSIKGVPWELQPGVEREVVNRVQLDVRAAIIERQAPPPTDGEQLPRIVYIISGIGEVRVHGQVYRVPACEMADHSEECRARIVTHMTADDDLNQRVRIAQDRLVETAPSEARTGERDSVPEPCRLTRAIKTAQKDRKLPMVLTWN